MRAGHFTVVGLLIGIALAVGHAQHAAVAPATPAHDYPVKPVVDASR